VRLRRRAAVVIGAAVLVLAATLVGPAAGAQAPVVRAVLFYSPTCGHCEYVIDELLFPVWFPQFGGEAVVRWDESSDDPAFTLATNGTLEVLFVNVTVTAGREMHLAVGEALGIPERRLGSVPRLVVGDRYLIGSREIPDEFPGIVEAGLAGGGMDWPGIPGMADALAAIPPAEPATTTTATAPPTSTTAASSTTTAAATSAPPTSAPPTTASSTATTSGSTGLPTSGDSMWERFARDETANSLALVVLGLMLLSVVGAGVHGRKGRRAEGPGLGVPLLALVGLGVAIYLAFVEAGGVEAVCGPVGNCNAVQHSEWARVFGVIPVGAVGVAGYAVVLAAWGLARFGPRRWADWSRVALLAGAAAGVGFSLYLTFLEPLVIGATCLWCLGSAVIVTVLLWLTARPGVAAWRRLRERGPGLR
jgi:uncharacterized membrane protein